MVNTSSPKGQTIRELLAHCVKAQLEIQTELDINFNKAPKDDSCKERPACPNILDEFIDSLRDLHEKQLNTIRFIGDCINSKL